MAPKCPSATWPPFLSASLCHHTTYAGLPLRQLSFHQTWPFQIDEAWITVTWLQVRMNDFSCHFGDLGCIRQLQGPFVIRPMFYQIEVKALSARVKLFIHPPTVDWGLWTWLDRQSLTGYEVIFFMNQPDWKVPQFQLFTTSALSLSPIGSLSG